MMAMHSGMGRGAQQRQGGFGFIPLFLDDDDDDLPEAEPAIEVIKTVQ